MTQHVMINFHADLELPDDEEMPTPEYVQRLAQEIMDREPGCVHVRLSFTLGGHETVGTVTKEKDE